MEERRRKGAVTVSRAVARMALQWKGRVACQEGQKGTLGLSGVEKHIKGRDLGNEVRLFVLWLDKQKVLKGQV